MINIVQVQIEKALKHHADIASNINTAFHKSRMMKLIDEALGYSGRSSVVLTLNQAKHAYREMEKIGRRDGKMFYHEIGNLLRQAHIDAALIESEQAETASLHKELAALPKSNKAVTLTPAQAKKRIAELMGSDPDEKV